MREIRSAGMLTGDREKIRITIDATDGYTWPWAWYLRNYSKTGYPDIAALPTPQTPDGKIVVLNSRNRTTIEESLKDNYTNGRKIVHRWWFPEEYRDLTPGEFFGTVFKPEKWRSAVDYFIYRRLPHDLGRVESYVYFSKDIPLEPPQ
ncbi:MAG: hypothetical protein HY678_04775 [Chloroflexi bacterium]|nr:hypothetical protein [Chloroflexota bacterium]